MSKYLRLKKDLDEKGEGKMTCFGSSMTPILKSGSTLLFKKCDKYKIGDIVFCKVRGRWIDSHKITKISHRGYMISNNHGWDNGWTKQVYGKMIKIL